MELQFLGTGSAFTPITENFQSNMVIKSDSGKQLLIDCGSDARHAMLALGIEATDIDGVYISHLHADHAGGLEWLAFSSTFSKEPFKCKLFVHPSMIGRLWNNVLSGGLQSIEGDKPAELADFYQIMPIVDDSFTWEGLHFKLIKTIHTCNGTDVAPSYGLFITSMTTKVFLTTDTRFEPHCYYDYFEQADIIFHDCDTSTFKSPVHAHFTELETLPSSIKAKMWLYHYPPRPEQHFNPQAAGFQGFVKKGQSFQI